ncbi:MAG: sulfite exporter TauE/SafE family protein [Sedimentisphaerales bacterium]|jgi:uncharacterized membrane protein YfcA
MANIFLCLLVGVVAGILSGILGIGGGVIIIPALIFLFGMTQHMAQGTTLALMIPPIGILAAMEYYKKGFVDIKIAALICIGFVLGGFLGAKFAMAIDEQILKKIFGIFFLIISLRMIFFK